ncbi:MAG: hypothetical protein ACLP0A_01135, partial [Verrucomicrobiia bacterium]
MGGRWKRKPQIHTNGHECPGDFRSSAEGAVVFPQRPDDTPLAELVGDGGSTRWYWAVDPVGGA